jgi:predicted transcriptional regulator
MSSDGNHPRKLFTDLEHEVMSIVWRRGTATAQEVQEDLAFRRRLRDSTVRTLLSRLEEKGYLKHIVRGRTYVYASAEAPRRLAARLVRQLIERFCAGSAEQLVAGMVDHELLDPEQLRRLADEIERESGSRGSK